MQYRTLTVAGLAAIALASATALAGVGDPEIKLTATDAAAGDEFGLAVAISGTTAIVGAHLDDDNGADSGAAYLFDATTGLQGAKLLANDGVAGDDFGFSVSIDGTTAVVGAFSADGQGSASGSAYLFDTITGLRFAKPSVSDGAAFDFFGVSTAIDGTTAIIGANWDDDNGTESGSAYLFDTTSIGVPASTTVRNGSGVNAMLLGKVSDPILGATWSTNLDCSGHSVGLALLEVHSLPLGQFFLAGGELLVDVTSPLVARELLFHAGGVVQFSIAVPSDTSLCGFTATAQGAVLGAPA